MAVFELTDTSAPDEGRSHMLIAEGERNGRRLIVFGLSAENLRRLQADQPMLITPETHPCAIPNTEIVIIYGATAQAIAERLRSLGAINEHTKQITVPRGPAQPR